MTGKIWGEWVHQIDSRMRSLGRHIALIIDNCAAHVEVTGLTNIKIINLPPNTTTSLQPCDQGIIQAFKKRYRSRLLKQTLAAYEAQMEPELNLRQAIDILNNAWNEVTFNTIANCWRHAGFVRSADAVNEQEAEIKGKVCDRVHSER
jgi:hypothetical protein